MMVVVAVPYGSQSTKNGIYWRFLLLWSRAGQKGKSVQLLMRPRASNRVTNVHQRARTFQRLSFGMRVLHPIRTLSARRVFRSWTLCQNGWGFQVRAKSLRTRPARPYEVGRRSRASHGLRMGTLRRSLPGAEAMRVDGRALEAKPRFGAPICCQIVKPVLRRHRSAMVAFASPRPCEWTCRRV